MIEDLTRRQKAIMKMMERRPWKHTTYSLKCRISTLKKLEALGLVVRKDRSTGVKDKRYDIFWEKR